MAASFPCANGGELYVVAVGIEDYQRVGELNKVDSAYADAEDFQKYVQSRWKTKAHVTLLKGPQATKYGIEDAVYFNLTQAGANDSVYLFISAHGVMAPHTNEGYILTNESQSGNGAGTGIPLSYFDTLLRGRQQPGPVYVFADLCRQAAPLSNNWIQRRLEELAKDNVSVQGILATTPDKQSTKHVFTNALVGAIALPALDPGSKYDLFYEEVKKRAPNQIPDKLPFHLATPRPITRYRPAPQFNRYPGEIAMLGSPIPLLFAMQAAASTERVKSQFTDALANGNLTVPGGAFDLLQALKSLETPSLAADDTASLLRALEDNGQQAIADYGSGEQFPNDPMKLDAARFLQAADYFEHASMLEPPERKEHKDEIDSRAWFCKGRAKLFDGPRQDIAGAADDLNKAVGLHPGFPEPYNGLGIVHLARGKSAGAAQPPQPLQVAAELADAASQFKQAVDIAPMWSYSRHNLALTYSEKGDFRQAEKTYTKAIQLTSFHPYLQYNLGLLLQNENRLREAERQYKSAEKVFQTLIDKHNRAQKAADGLRAPGSPDGQYYQARFDLEGKIVTALQENLAETYNALGTLREDRHDSTGAEDFYNAALKQADL
jgi:tetratricopeptide (TPR) repeat protein